MNYFYVGLIVCVMALVCLVMHRQQRKAFEARFPPISDEEFMARCPPGTHPEIALKVRRIVANSLGIDYQRIYPSSRFVTDLGCD